MFEKKVMEILYQKAKSPDELPWHSEEPARFLVEAVKQRQKTGKALDLGCGTGIYAIYLAKEGFEVTGLDFIAKALEMAEQRAKTEKVNVTWILTDLLDWKSADVFDLILDSGCLHGINGGNMARYKKQLLAWLKPDADFILAHFGKRHFLDWRPIGPKRRTRQSLVRFFSPELREKAYEHEIETGIPLPIGPTVLTQSFWFQPERSPLLATR
jgi:cyclopropane fatty-acyl-phospholipid synthase-like methyltransferase